MALDVISWIFELIGNSCCAQGQTNERLGCDSDRAGFKCNQNIHSFSICCSWTVGYLNNNDNLNYRFIHSVLQSLQHPTEVKKTGTVPLSTDLQKAVRI